MRSATATIALVVVIGVLGGFYAGWKYSQTHITATPVAAAGTANGAGVGTGAGAGTGTGRAAGAASAGAPAGAISGPITAVGAGTITIHDQATDKDVKIAFAPTVRILKTGPGTPADLTQDARATVVGQPDAGGTIQASAITIGNAGALFGGGGGGRGRPAPTPSP